MQLGETLMAVTGTRQSIRLMIIGAIDSPSRMHPEQITVPLVIRAHSVWSEVRQRAQAQNLASDANG